LIESGALGVLDHFRSQWVAAYAANPRGALTWRFRRDEAGLGILGDLGSHAVDLAQFLLGPIAAVTARTETIVSERPLPTAGATHFAVVESGELAAVENEDVVWSIVHFERGVTGTIEASRVAVGPQARYAFEVHGSSGAVAWDFERMNGCCLPSARERRQGYARVVMAPSTHRSAGFSRVWPALGYDDLKVIEAALFQSVVDGPARAGHPRGAGGCVRDRGDGALGALGRLGAGRGPQADRVVGRPSTSRSRRRTDRRSRTEVPAARPITRAARPSAPFTSGPSPARTVRSNAAHWAR
jgi:hypothetical protein